MVVRRWVRGLGWRYEEIQLRHEGDIWQVRRIGQVWMPDETYDSEDEAQAVIDKTLSPDWTEVPARRNPRIRYGP
jgi:hypothetical protein